MAYMVLLMRVQIMAGLGMECYVENEETTADLVAPSGHGTKVAGSILFPMGISNAPNPYELPCKIS